jgi:arylsulfatase A-like enzyme
MIFRIPNEPSLDGLRKKEVVGLVDIVPTLNHLLGEVDTDADGISLLPTMLYSDGSILNRTILSQTTAQRLYARRGPDFSFICNPRGGERMDELYLLSQDPMQRENVASEYPVFSAYQRFELRRQLDILGPRLNKIRRTNAVIDEKTEEELRSLGYVD